MILWVWAIVDLYKNYTKSNRKRWLLWIILFPVIGSIIYFQKKPKKASMFSNSHFL
ncbi:MAG: PLDc_N domain-containing protein [Bacteroidales bacterium]|nr:PLDc_N domain-containing protein [Bacteroidales bacterium]